MQHSPEQLRQHEEHKARRMNWFAPQKPKPVLELAPPVAKEPKKRPAFVPEGVNVYDLPVWRRPYWARVKTHFNHHMVAYYAWHLRREEDVQALSEVKRPMKDIALEVLKDFPGVTLEDLKGPRQTKNLIIPRQLAMYRIIKERQDSYPAIGRFFGGRDHSTALHAVRKIEKMVNEGLL